MKNISILIILLTVIRLHAEDKVKILTAATFSDNTRKGYVLVDFHAELRCVPCRLQAPVMTHMGEECKDVIMAKVDVDLERSLSKTYHVGAVPCLVLFKDGNEVSRLTGFRDEDKLKQWLAKF